jgi:hypothetical protein
MTTNTETSDIGCLSSNRLTELGAWDDAIAGLDTAMANAAGARDEINHTAEEIDLIEARATLLANGTNAEARKAAVTLALAEDESYRALLAQNRAARQRLADAERRAAVLKERCRLLRTTAMLAFNPTAV